MVFEHAARQASFIGPKVVGGILGGPKGIAFDGPFHRERSPLETVNKVTTPTFIIGGQSDLFQRSEPLLFNELQKNGTPAKLLFGPWSHATGGANSIYDPPLGDSKLNNIQLRWFDHYVKGKPDPNLNRDLAPVSYSETRDDANKDIDSYQRAESWPPKDVRYRSYELGPAKGIGQSGTLRPGDSGPGGSSWVPWNPAAGACSKSTSQWLAGAPICNNDNSLNDKTGPVFDMPVTGKPLKLAGPMSGHFSVSTGAKDGQLTARVEEVAPDGTSKQVAAGWQVLSLRKLDKNKSEYRDGKLIQPYHPYTEDSKLTVPANTTMGIDVEILPAAAKIEPGHKLRIALQTADFPHLFPPLPQLADSVGTGLTVHHDQKNLSYVNLPVRD